MTFERWMIPQANGQRRSILATSGCDRVDVAGQKSVVARGPAVGAGVLAHPLRLAYAGEVPTTKRHGNASVSFALAAAQDASLPGDDDSADALLRYGELLTAWAAVASEVGLAVLQIEAVEFGRFEVALTTTKDGNWDLGASLALLAECLHEVAFQRGMQTSGMRIESAPEDVAGAKTAWGLHLAVNE